MKEIFETFRPKNPRLNKYIDYYYLDIKPNNSINRFQCFPHFNNTISLYKSHSQPKEGEIAYDKTAKPFQIFTPIRENVLNVTQLGIVHRIVIVFHPLGIQQFYENLNFSSYITNYEFFTQNELNKLFITTETEIMLSLLDSYLEQRFKKYENNLLEKSIQYIFNHYENFSVSEISKEVGISRQHLNRVFQSHLGISVKKFHRIVLFRQTIKKKFDSNLTRNFTELAHIFNFNDQSHFNKTYKSLTGKSPKTFFKEGTMLGKEDTFWHLQT